MKQAASLVFLCIFVAILTKNSARPTTQRAPENNEKDKDFAKLKPVSSSKNDVDDVEPDEYFTLSPWTAHVAIEEEYRRWSLPFFQCRTELSEDLGGAGRRAETAVGRVVELARDFLDGAVRRMRAVLPATPERVGLADPEIAAIEASLAGHNRSEASDLLEARWHRAREVGVQGPSMDVLRVRSTFLSLEPRLWAIVNHQLARAAPHLHPGGRAALGAFADCMAFELSQLVNGPDEEPDQDDDGTDKAE